MLAQRQRVAQSCSAFTVLLCCVFFVVVDIEYVTSMSLDRLNVEHNDIQQSQNNEGALVIDDDRRLSALPSRGDHTADMYVLLPAIEKNTIDTDAFVVNAANGEPDMLMVESHIEPAIEAAPAQLQSAMINKSDLDKQSSEIFSPESNLDKETLAEKAVDEIIVEKLNDEKLKPESIPEEEAVDEHALDEIISEKLNEEELKPESIPEEAAALEQVVDEIIAEKLNEEGFKPESIPEEATVVEEAIDESIAEKLNGEEFKPESMPEEAAVIEEAVDENIAEQINGDEEKTEFIEVEKAQTEPAVKDKEDVNLGQSNSESDATAKPVEEEQTQNAQTQSESIMDIIAEVMQDKAEENNAEIEEIPLGSVVEQEEEERTETPLDNSKVEESVLNDSYLPVADTLEHNETQTPKLVEIKEQEEEGHSTSAPAEFVENATPASEDNDVKNNEKSDINRNEETVPMQDNNMNDEVVTEKLAEEEKDESEQKIVQEENVDLTEIAAVTETFTLATEEAQPAIKDEVIVLNESALTAQLENSGHMSEESQYIEAQANKEVEELENQAAEKHEIVTEAATVDSVTAIDNQANILLTEATEKNAEIESQTELANENDITVPEQLADDQNKQIHIAMDEVEPELVPETASLLTTIIQVPQKSPEQEQSLLMQDEPTKLQNPATQIITQRPLAMSINVMDSVLNYVNASFMNQQEIIHKKHTTNQTTENEEDANTYKTTLRSYEGAQVWRIVVQSDKDRKLADELLTKYGKY